eukprot:992914-Rhodomonas_salina.1
MLRRVPAPLSRPLPPASLSPCSLLHSLPPACLPPGALLCAVHAGAGSESACGSLLAGDARRHARGLPCLPLGGPLHRALFPIPLPLCLERASCHLLL